MKAPRLQLRWGRAEPNKDGYGWQCNYELVLPLRNGDIRREIYNDDGDVIGEKRELVIPIKEPTLRGSTSTPCSAQNGDRYFDTPYRDGAHAEWDSKLLGGLPIYVIAPDGTAIEAEK